MKKIFLLLLLLTVFTAAARPIPFKISSATHGATYKSEKNVLVIDFPAYSPALKNTHPTLNMLLPPDCSKYDGVDVDLRLSNGLSSSIAINFRDNKGKQCYDVRPVVDGSRTILRFRFNPSRKLDRKNMKYLRIYLSRPALAAQFTIYSIKLFSVVDEKKTELRSAAEKFGLTKELAAISSLEDCEKFTVALRKKQLDKLIADSRSFTGSTTLGAGFVSPLDRPLPFYGAMNEMPVSKGKIALAAGETENIHIVTVSSKPIKTISASTAAAAASVSLTVHPVGAVKTVSSRARGVHTGWHFDPILEYTDKVTSLAPYQLQLWVVRAKAQAPVSKTLLNKIIFNADGKKFTLPLETRVYGFTLPKRKTLKTATSVYGSKLMGKRKKDFEKWLLRNFCINGFSIYSETGTYGQPQLPPVSDYVQAVREGTNFIPILYLKLPRQAHHTGKKIAPDKQSKGLWEKMTPQEQARYPEEWKKKYVEILKKRIPELKKAGVWQYAACYAFDEAAPSERPAIIDLVKELKKHFPDLKIISTLGDHSYGFQSGLHGIIDAWIPTVWQYNFDRAEQARKMNRKVWYYTTGMTVDATPLSQIRTQLGECAIASRVDGWLVWTVSRWYGNTKPISGTDPLTAWNPESYPGDNGGGSYFCMGEKGTFLSTLRAEAMRDGLEDYEYYTILKQLAGKRKMNDPLRRQAKKLYNDLSRSEAITPGKLLENRAQAAELIERMK